MCDLSASAIAKVAKAVDILVMHGIDRDVAGRVALTLLDVYAPERRVVSKRPTTAVAEQSKPILHLYRALYGAKYREEPMISGDDFGKVYKLLQYYGPQAVTARLNAFYAWEDPWVEKCGRTLQVFYQQWNKLASVLALQQQRAGPTDCRHTPLCLTAVVHSQKQLAERSLPSNAPMSTPHIAWKRSAPS